VCYDKFKNINKDNTEEWLLSDVCELGFQHDRHGQCQYCHETKGRRRVWGDESEEGISHSMALHCVVTLLDYMGQRGFEYSDITTARKICAAVRRSGQFTKTSNHYKLFLKINASYVKKL
jgi:hypothetical protein